MKRQKSKLLLAGVLIFSMLAGFLPENTIVLAAETATVRIISTTDLHGQLSSSNYDSAGTKSVGNLAQDYTLIKEARSEITNGTSITVDVGDSIYGYGSDYVYANGEKEYMYAAMAEMKYDAFVLGNHDFDYGYSYVKKQLKNAGIADKCVVANVFDAKTGKNIWKENMIVTKTIKTSTGAKRTIKIGIVGVTRPGLTNYYNHTGILMTQDILESAKLQVKKLKEKGADLIIAAAHSGIGSENPQYFDGDVSYALTKIDGIDAVMCGHSHLNYPSKDSEVQDFYNYKNVNKKTGLMNGKPVVMVADHGAGIGIADLKITIKNGKVSVASSKAEIRYPTKDTKESSVAVKYKKIYDEMICQTYEEEVGTMADDKSVTNYFGMVSDNEAIQLVNEGKIRLGLSYINTQDTEYKDHPVIAVSTYKKYGAESKEDYIDIDGTITMGDLLGIQTYYHDFSYIYYITGKQLREWLEWTASAYAVPGSKAKTGDTVIDSYVSGGKNSLLQKEWVSDWSKFFMFDGIEYKFDISKPAKYSAAGKVVNADASRVVSLTYNGEPVSDDKEFILVSDIITATKVPVAKALVNQRLYKSGEYSFDILKNYVEDLAAFGPIDFEPDKNWDVLFPTDTDFVIRSSSLSEEVAKKQPWYQETLSGNEDYKYYRASFSKNYFTDTNGPTLVATPTITLKTNRAVPIAVQASDESKVTTVRYAAGKYERNDAIWSSSSSSILKENQFLATANGTYSIWAMDSLGNTSVRYVKISNIDPMVLQVPDVNRLTNKSSTVTGTGEPGATVTINAGGKKYTATVGTDGNFSRKIGYQPADSVVTISQKGVDGRKSDTLSVTILRAGPNYPDLKEITNKNDAITVELDEEGSQIFAVIDGIVYVSNKGGKDLYEESSRYDEELEIVETDFTSDGERVSLSIPVQMAGTEVTVYSMDSIGRVNYPKKLTVKEVAPELPVLFSNCDSEHYVFGYVPEPKNAPYEIKVTVNGESFTGNSDNNGYFKVKTCSLKKDDMVYVTASDVVDSVVRESAKQSRKVASYESFVDKSNASTISLTTIDSKETTISGYVEDFEGTLYVKAGSQFYEVEIGSLGSFEIELAKPLKANSTVSAVLRGKHSNIRETAGFQVQKALPDKPVLLTTEITTNTTKVKISSADKCKANVKIGSKVYFTREAKQNSKTGLYTYVVEIEKSKKDKDVYIYMENSAGKSKRVKTKVMG